MNAVVYKEALDFMFEEIVRIRSLSRAKLKKEMEKTELPYLIPNLLGTGSTCCSKAAFARVESALDVYLRKRDVRHLVAITSARGALMSRALDYFQSEAEYTDQNVKALFDEVIDFELSKNRRLTHIVPCHLVSSERPDSFAIGPVKFVLTKKFLEKSDFSNSIQSNFISLVNLREGYRKLALDEIEKSKTLSEVSKNFEKAINYYKQFRWVASVEIPAAEEGLSRKHALKCVDASMNFLRVIFGTSATENIKIDDSNGVNHQSSVLVKDNEGVFHFINRTQLSHDEFVKVDWWDSLLSQNGSIFLEEIGEVISQLASLNPPTQIAQRVIDAAAWYGQASTDNWPGTKLIKYLSALERITLFGGKRSDITKRVSQGAAALCADGRGNEYSEICSRVSKLYDARSALVHGSISPYNESLTKPMREAEKLVAQSILQFLGLAFGSALRDFSITDDDMASAIVRLRQFKIGQKKSKPKTIGGS